MFRSFYQVLRGKRGNPRAGDLFTDLEGNLLRLQRELREGIYLPGGYHTFWVHEPKSRMISAAPVRDRVVHHALVNVIEPVFEPRLPGSWPACGRRSTRARAASAG